MELIRIGDARPGLLAHSGHGGRGRTGEACGLLAVDQSLGADSQGAAVSSRKA